MIELDLILMIIMPFSLLKKFECVNMEGGGRVDQDGEYM